MFFPISLFSVVPFSYFVVWCPDGSDSKESACNVGETRVRSLGQEGPLEKGMATHSSILVEKIPWTEEPGGVQSMGLKRIRHG